MAIINQLERFGPMNIGNKPKFKVWPKHDDGIHADCRCRVCVRADDAVDLDAAVVWSRGRRDRERRDLALVRYYHEWSCITALILVGLFTAAVIGCVICNGHEHPPHCPNPTAHVPSHLKPAAEYRSNYDYTP